MCMRAGPVYSAPGEEGRGKGEERGEERGRGEGRTLDVLPDGVGPGPQDVAAADIVVVHHLCLGDDLRVPRAQVVFL